MTINPGTDPTLVTGAWREGNPRGSRQFVDIGDLALESGAVVPGVRLAFETWGKFDGSNAVLILHALTADSHVVGPAAEGHVSGGWWEGLVGPGKAIDTNRLFVVAANILGGCQGSTGPASFAPDGEPWGGSFPYVTVRDQVRAEGALADSLGIDRWYGVIGGSAGGMRGLEWAIEWPARVERLFLLATTAATSTEQIALSATQVDAIRADPNFAGGDYYNGPAGPSNGLDLALRIAHISYRSELELAERFGRSVQGDEAIGKGGRFAVESYLQHHGAKLVNRFDANSYIVLSEAMNSHDVGRGRGGIEAALARVTAETLVAGIDSDRLYPLSQQQRLADGILTSGPLEIVKSRYGHDGFLIETEQVGELARKLLTQQQ
ncbi:homoserine O-acetyltransferase MetX [Aeromicrobium sp.]